MASPKPIVDTKAGSPRQGGYKSGGAADDWNLWPEGETPKKSHTIDDFELVSALGQGSYGEVFRAKRKRRERGESSSSTGSPRSDKYYALKIMSKVKIGNPKEILSERAVLQCLDHPFVVRLVNAFQSPTKLCLVLSYLPGGNLKMHKMREKVFNPQKAAFATACVLLALEYIHSRNIIYRDLKPENIVLDERGYPVVTDMGLAKEVQNRTAHTCCGTPLYVAPEVLQNTEGGYTAAVDWWSFGIILAELLQRDPPFYSNNSKALFELIRHRPPTLDPGVVDVAKLLILDLLEKDPKKRLADPSQIRQRPFFALFGFDWTLLTQRKVCLPPILTPMRATRFPPPPPQYGSVLLSSAPAAPPLETEHPLSGGDKARILEEFKRLDGSQKAEETYLVCAAALC